jgi:hypothetical protein
VAGVVQSTVDGGSTKPMNQDSAAAASSSKAGEIRDDSPATADHRHDPALARGRAPGGNRAARVLGVLSARPRSGVPATSKQSGDVEHERVLGHGWWGVSIHEPARMIVLLGGVLLAGFLMR